MRIFYFILDLRLLRNIAAAQSLTGHSPTYLQVPARSGTYCPLCLNRREQATKDEALLHGAACTLAAHALIGGSSFSAPVGDSCPSSTGAKFTRKRRRRAPPPPRYNPLALRARPITPLAWPTDFIQTNAEP